MNYKYARLRYNFVHFGLSSNAVKEATQYFHRKLLVSLSTQGDIAGPITVSKEKAAHFLNWLSGTLTFQL